MRARRARPTPQRKHSALWAIIYIDLMTQIMAFFVIVWAVERTTDTTETASLGTGMGQGDQTVRMVDLPGDVLFPSAKTELTVEGRDAIDKLFGDASSGVLGFDQGGLARRKLVIHGHTDEVGDKDANFLLGYERAWAVYQAIRVHSSEVPDYVVLCTHADNTSARELPPVDATVTLTVEEREVIREARAKNRRITIEDLVVGVPVATQ